VRTPTQPPNAKTANIEFSSRPQEQSEPKHFTMAQGAIKAKKPSNSIRGKKPSVLGPKKGARTIAPKKAVLVKNAKMTKVCSH
jgi:hypothetical protein